MTSRGAVNLCPGSNQPGDFRFTDGFADWYVDCPVCGCRSAGGSSTSPEHRGATRQEAVRASSAQQGDWQATAEHFEALLSMLRVEEKGEDSRHMTLGERGEIT